MCPYIIYNIRMQIMKQIPKFKNEDEERDFWRIMTQLIILNPW